VTAAGPSGTYLDRPSGGGLVDVVDLILDKGLVIDVYLRVSLVGIELLTVDARIVVASVDTYLRFAEAVNRLDLAHGDSETHGLPGLMDEIREGGAEHKTKGALEGAEETVEDTVGDMLGRDEDGPEPGRPDGTEAEREERPHRSRPASRKERGR
jgi:gas vesicle structural protein